MRWFKRKTKELDPQFIDAFWEVHHSGVQLDEDNIPLVPPGFTVLIRGRCDTSSEFGLTVDYLDSDRRVVYEEPVYIRYPGSRDEDKFIREAFRRTRNMILNKLKGIEYA